MGALEAEAHGRADEKPGAKRTRRTSTCKLRAEASSAVPKA